MSVSKKYFGVQGYKEVKTTISKDVREVAKALEFLKYAPLKEGKIKEILTKGGEPLRAEVQQQYVKSDPTGMNGDVGIFVEIRPARRKLDTVYIGPAGRISKGWKLWYVLNYGHAHKAKDGNTVKMVRGKRFIDKAVAAKKGDVIELVKKEFEKAMSAYAKKLGFDTKGY